MDPALDDADEGERIGSNLLLDGRCLLGPPQGLVYACRCLRAGMAGLREHVQHRDEVGSDGCLVPDDLSVRHVDIAVDVLLKRPRVRHDRTFEREPVVDVALHGPAGAFRPTEDVCIRDDDLGAKPVRHLSWRNQDIVGVDHRQEGRRLHGPVASRQTAEAAESVAVDDLEHSGPS